MFEATGAIIASVLRVGVPIYVAAFIASVLLLFLPDAIAEQIGIATFRQIWRGDIGTVFIASIALLASSGISAISHSFGNNLGNRRLQRLNLEALRMLTEDEKKILRSFIIDGENTKNAPINSGIAGGLVAKGIIYRSSNIGHVFGGFSYNLQPISRKILAQNLYLLD
jgi:hypothetical protein